MRASHRSVVAAALLAGCPGVTAMPDAARPADARAAPDASAPDAPDVPDVPDVPSLAPRFAPWEGAAAAPCSAGGWCWEHPSPAGGSIAAIAARGNEGWALTRDGVVITASADGLRARRVHPYDPTRAVGTIAVLSPAAVWIAFPGALLRWDGERFERAEFFDGMSEPTRVWSGGSDELWLAGPVGTVLRFDGRAWSDRSIATGAAVVALSGGAGELWAQTADGVVWRLRDGAWARGETRSPDDHRSLWINAPDDAWTCGDGTAFHWDGARWSRAVVDRAPASRLCAVWSDGDGVWFSDGSFVRRRNADGAWDIEAESSQVTAVGGAASDLWLGRQDGVIQRLAEGRFLGVTRTRPRFDLTRLAGRDEATLRALTPASLLAFDGRGWFEASAPVRFYELHGAFPVDRADTWLAGLSRLGTRDVGRVARWSREAGERDVQETDAPLRAVSGSAADDVWAVGDAGAAWRWDGARWTRVDTGVSAALRDVWVRAPDDAWAVGDGATALRWDGVRWRSFPLPLPLDLTRVHGRASDDAWAIGSDPRGSWVLRWDGARWTRDTAGLPAGYVARGIWAAPDGDVWLAGSAALRRTRGVWLREDAGVEASLTAVWGTREGTLRLGGTTSTVLVRRP